MKKLLWVVISCLMALSLLIASCGESKTDSGASSVEDDGNDTVVITESETETSTGAGSTYRGSSTTGCRAAGPYPGDGVPTC